MNKLLYLAVGAILGAAGGSAATYYLSKAKMEDRAADELEDYATHRDEREEALRAEIEDLKNKLGVVKSVRPTNQSDDEDSEVKNNAGVKKYHHYDSEEVPEYASKRIFKKVTTKEEEMAKKEVSHVSEISESLYLDSDREKQTIDVLFRYIDDAVEEIWGYQTDNQTTVQARFGKKLIDLIGIDGEDMLDWIEPDEGTAVKYFRNSDMGIDFEIVVHCDPETYYNKES